MQDEKKEQEIKQKYLKVELLNKEYEQLCAKEDLINNKIAELLILKNSVDMVENRECYSQLGSGVFVFSQIIDNNNFLVNVGKKLFVRMNKNEVKNYLDKKLKDLEKVNSQISQRKKTLENEIQKQVTELYR